MVQTPEKAETNLAPKANLQAIKPLEPVQDVIVNLEPEVHIQEAIPGQDHDFKKVPEYDSVSLLATPGPETELSEMMPVQEARPVQEPQFVEEELPAGFWDSDSYSGELGLPEDLPLTVPDESLEIEALSEVETEPEDKAESLESIEQSKPDVDLLLTKFQKLFPGRVIRVETFKEDAAEEGDDSESIAGLFEETQPEGL